MRPSSFFAFATLLAAACAAPSPRAGFVLHERRASEPLDWTQSRRLDPSHVLPMKFGLTQTNLHKLEELLMEVSHPESPSFGKHWSPEQVVDMFAPTEETIGAVMGWLIDAGIAPERMKLSPSRGWIEFDATVEEAEGLIDAEYFEYHHEETGLKQISCESYHVPAHVKRHIDLIKPTVHFSHAIPKARNSKRSIPNKHIRKLKESGLLKPDGTLAQAVDPTDLSMCDSTITPACLRALYSIDYTPVATAKNSYGIVEFTPQAFLQNDLNLFFANFSSSQVSKVPNLIAIDGGVDQTTSQSFDDNGESDLDLEYAFALTDPQPLTLLQTGDTVEGASFNNWLDAVDASFCTFDGGDNPQFDGIYPDTARGGFKGAESCGIIKPPNVVSVSYGQDEASVTAAYAQRQCTEYGKLGMLGTSVLYSSGDDGVAGGGGVCLRNGRPNNRGTVFSPGFPVTCPFITAVGATQVDPGNSVTDPEGACEQVIFSGGGFSNFFAIPSYQQAAVSSFFANHPPTISSTLFNSTQKSRGFPDLSANGANYVIGIDGAFSLVFGTSASSPVVGSILTLVNDARIAAGKGPVGFINPTIYSSNFSSGFNDITHGGNQGCNTPGFTAVSGWDPVTGVGTPNTTKLIELWLALP